MDLLRTHDLNCPYCGEVIQVVVDCSNSIHSQEYIEDCQICCRPINISITIEGENVQLQATHENE